MMRYAWLVLVLTAVALGSACAETKGVPVEFASACSPENDKKVVEVTGFLEPRNFMYCSNRGGRMECGFDLKDTPGSKNIVRVDLEEGTSANMVEKLEKGFKTEDVKIHDKTGAVIALSDKVRVSGKITVVPPNGNAEGVCFMQATKIER